MRILSCLIPLLMNLPINEGWFKPPTRSLKEGEGKYGAQFLASRKGGFTSYFDEGTDENLDEAPVALDPVRR